MVADITVTDTKTVFQNICSFFPGATCLQFFKSVYLFVEQTCFFPGDAICSSNRHKFSRKIYRTKCFFPGGSISVRQTDIIISSNRFSQKPLFSPRTHTHFDIF